MYTTTSLKCQQNFLIYCRTSRWRSQYLLRPRLQNAAIRDATSGDTIAVIHGVSRLSELILIDVERELSDKLIINPSTVMQMISNIVTFLDSLLVDSLSEKVAKLLNLRRRETLLWEAIVHSQLRFNLALCLTDLSIHSFAKTFCDKIVTVVNPLILHSLLYAKGKLHKTN